ncbi:tRNA (adenosine(37)-N6)-dimethylallyltransferase MiaA [Candidatus Falkowbacteria bacterium]|nr:tRNA (adenosine(37)-N6)-dimethylallyltransferase MiaA [Candidatus Falkowbacteria bacterium]
MKSNKVIVILGPTSSGKTKIAVKLARKFDGEIISADSRQVYKGMDIGTGKDLDDYVVKSEIRNPKSETNYKSQISKFETARIPYHLVDVVSPKKQFTVAEWQARAYKAIDDILSCGKVPIVVGGTGLYISALVYGYDFGKITDMRQVTRDRLNKLTLKRLLARLKKVDPKTYKVIDKKNRRRVQRALEIYYQTGQPKSRITNRESRKPRYDFLLLGVTFPREVLNKRIEKRLKERLKQGMAKEVKKLKKQGVSWKRLDGFGLEYRFVSRHLRGKISEDEMFSQLKKAIRDFAKRQMTWFKRNNKIKWLNDYKEIELEAKKFLGA